MVMIHPGLRPYIEPYRVLGCMRMWQPHDDSCRCTSTLGRHRMNVLAVDVGGTKTLLGIVTPAGDIVSQSEHPTRIGIDDIERVSALTVEELASATEPVGAVCVGFPEYVSAEGLLTSREVLTWAEQPARVIHRAIAARGLEQLPVRIDSDVRLGALGEATFGVGVDRSSFIYVSLGTGLSSAFVVSGAPWRGSRGEAIALGEWPGPEGTTLERYASGTAITQRYEHLTGVARTARDIVTASATDPVARGILETAGSALGRACADIVSLIDPAVVIIGGGLGSAPTLLSEAAHRAYISATARRDDSPPWVVAGNGARSGLLGAAAAALPLCC
ncbi:MAG: hypothetical protein B5766_09315 [Candidatus Lumbricidophila eiseniae]|uniref:ROK family protein n=1 Tax=Candidatus Lumbricidiphila eiseniae TaxID=1969409 RepID=A0A2A6FQ85_9MICO|nr:MAG: hypothetical protein B5766_09315 [Candidatus Lumbricidophila eiseniae]